MLIENESFPVSSNSLVVIGAQVTHTEISDPENPLDYYVLGEEGLKLNTDKEPEYIHVPASANSPFIRQCFQNILREMHNKQDRYAEICQHYLDILILYFCRKDHVSYEVVDAQNSSHECHKVKRFIEHNYQSMISLDSLAENCSLSKYYLSHRFAELYGKSPIAYRMKCGWCLHETCCSQPITVTKRLPDVSGFPLPAIFRSPSRKIFMNRHSSSANPTVSGHDHVSFFT